MLRRAAFAILTSALRAAMRTLDRLLGLHRRLAERWGLPVRW